jgi:hypothetical protein
VRRARTYLVDELLVHGPQHTGELDGAHEAQRPPALPHEALRGERGRRGRRRSVSGGGKGALPYIQGVGRRGEART